MKAHALFLLALACNLSSTSALANEDMVIVNTTRQEHQVIISASFTLPLSNCEAYRYLTDNSSQNALPGIVYVKSKRIAPNKVQIDRRILEQVLFVPVHLDSVIEVTELPYTGTDFVQISGSAQSYRGSWRLEAVSDGTRFIFKGITDPGSMMPGFLVEHYMSKNLRKSFEEVARVGATRKGFAVDECRISS